MLDFNILIHKGNEVIHSSVIPQGKYKIDFKKDILKVVSLPPYKELRVIEPGNKIPISNYLQLGQFCETCDNVTAHVRNPETKNIRCLKCKTKTKYQ